MSILYSDGDGCCLNRAEQILYNGSVPKLVSLDLPCWTLAGTIGYIIFCAASAFCCMLSKKLLRITFVHFIDVINPDHTNFWSKAILAFLYQNDWLLESLLQWYEALWNRDIDTTCNRD